MKWNMATKDTETFRLTQTMRPVYTTPWQGRRCPGLEGTEETCVPVLLGEENGAQPLQRSPGDR